MPPSKSVDRLVIVLGDQLNEDSPAFDEFNARTDVVWMAEATKESTHVWTHKARIALFLAAMRTFREHLTSQKFRVAYQQLDDPQAQPTLGKALKHSIQKLKPNRLEVVKPGAYRVEQELQAAADQVGLPLRIMEDNHFLGSLEEFEQHAASRKQLRQEFYYRELRKKHGILLEEDGKPVGGKWNYDASNRGHFGKTGPRDVPPPHKFRFDSLARQTFKQVQTTFADHPGSLDNFNWPLTKQQAERALDSFIEYRLPSFGKYQDALWSDQPFLYHSLLSSSLNLKLLHPQTVIRRAEDAYQQGHAPLESVEGFIRQVLGWREYVRGVYWRYMPEYLERNFLEAKLPLPDFYWTGDTEINCLRHAVSQTLEHGYAHHIQRLMITGLFALLLGIDPKEVHKWYLAVYVDAVEWVEVPNTLGMSQYADGGVMGSKPYCATGKYVDRMSNYCAECQFDPKQVTGPDACPFTTLYWDFLSRNRDKLRNNNRMSLQLKNEERKSKDEREAIKSQAEQLRSEIA